MSNKVIHNRRKILYAKQEGVCEWCRQRCNLDFDRLGNGQPVPSRRFFTLDHVLPRGRGGSNRLENIVGACYNCNKLRNDIENRIRDGKAITPYLSLPHGHKLLPVFLPRKESR